MMRFSSMPISTSPTDATRRTDSRIEPQIAGGAVALGAGFCRLFIISW
jgi:hypothetical protein